MADREKPFGGKAYGSIAHLPQSRVGAGDWSCEPTTAAIATTSSRSSDRKVDRVVVTEKLDGSCCAVGKLGGAVVPLVRAGYRARDSHHAQHHVFADWVDDNLARFDAALEEGERVPGEWLLMAHGTRYRVEDDRDLFVAFDLIVPGRGRGKVGRRLDFDETTARFDRGDLARAAVASDGPAIAVDDALERLGPDGRHGALDGVEGVVYRVETNGAYNFHCKFVRAGKVDGLYVPSFGLGSERVVLNGPAAERRAAKSGVDLDMEEARMAAARGTAVRGSAPGP